MPSLLTEKTTEVRSMLIIHQGAIGDFILALPALKTLRKAFPQAKAVVMGYPRILELVERRYYADEILAVDQRGFASFFVRGGDLDPVLSQFFATFDLLVVFGKDEEGPVVGNLKRVSQGEVIHVKSFLPWGERTHLADHLVRELARYGLPRAEKVPELYPKKSDQEWGIRFCKRKGLTEEEKSKAVVVHPGSGSKKKVWPLERFVELTRYIEKKSRARILIILGPAEGPEVQSAFEQIAWEKGPEAPLLVKGLSLLGLASVIQGCRLFIGNDSGISHLAAALKVPTLAIFGATDHKVWAPRGERVVVARAKMECSPCSEEKFFQCQTADCMKRVEMEDVLRALDRLGYGQSF